MQTLARRLTEWGTQHCLWHPEGNLWIRYLLPESSRSQVTHCGHPVTATPIINGLEPCCKTWDVSPTIAWSLQPITRFFININITALAEAHADVPLWKQRLGVTMRNITAHHISFRSHTIESHQHLSSERVHCMNRKSSTLKPTLRFCICPVSITHV